MRPRKRERSEGVSLTGLEGKEQELMLIEGEVTVTEKESINR